MKSVLLLFSNLIRYILSNIVDLLFILGVTFILIFVYASFGIKALILAGGIVCILAAVLLEINKSNKGNRRY